MIDIPMKIKSPESLGNMAADVERRIRQPQPLCQLMGSIMQPLPQASPGQFRPLSPIGQSDPSQGRQSPDVYRSPSRGRLYRGARYPREIP